MPVPKIPIININLKNFRCSYKDRKTYRSIKSVFSRKDWVLEKFEGQYANEEHEQDTWITKRYIASKFNEDSILLYKDNKGDWWTSDPYNSDVKLTSLTHLNWILSNQKL